MFKGMKKKKIKMSKDKEKFINTLTFFITDDCFVKELRKRTGLKVSKEKALDVLDNYQISYACARRAPAEPMRSS